MRSITDSELSALAAAVSEGARAIERRDRDTLEQIVAARWHDDCEWIPLIAAIEGETTYHGHEGLLEFYEDLWNAFDVRYGEPDLRQVEGTIVYLTTMELRGRESGIEMQIELGVVWEPDGDRIRRGRAYDSHAAALAAAEAVDA